MWPYRVGLTRIRFIDSHCWDAQLNRGNGKIASCLVEEIFMRLAVLWVFALLFVEIWSIIKMSEQVGFLATLILLVAGFIFGLQLMRSQGIGAMVKAAQNSQIGASPMGPIAGGIVKAFAGILLIIPGFISDVVALIILLPFVRNAFARHLTKKGQFQGFNVGGFGKGGFGAFGQGPTGNFGGFGKPGANDDYSGGNVYDHDGNAKVDEDSPRGRVIEGKVVELKPKGKSGDKSDNDSQ
ncbi:MAG: FxsA family protein [Gammaproteobacteria bacterium]|nr:MAG: FxsA family protein [Gammaproteobacteria bacterium]